MDSIEKKCVSTVSYLETLTTGSKWYTIGVLSSDRDAIANQDDRIYAATYDICSDPLDTLCAIAVQRQFNGLPPGGRNFLLWSTPEVVNALQVARGYILNT